MDAEMEVAAEGVHANLDEAERLRNVKKLNLKERHEFLKRLFTNSKTPKQILDLKIEGLSRSAIYRYYELYKSDHVNFRRPGSGRKQNVLENKSWFERYFENNKSSTCLDATRKYNEEHKTNIHRTTILRTLGRMGFSFQKAQSGVDLTEAQK
jgi:transposase